MGEEVVAELEEVFEVEELEGEEELWGCGDGGGCGDYGGWDGGVRGGGGGGIVKGRFLIQNAKFRAGFIPIMQFLGSFLQII